MKLTSLTRVIRADCTGSKRSSSRAQRAPAKPPPAITTFQATGSVCRAPFIRQTPGVRALAITYERDAGPGVFAEAAAEREIELEPWLRREDPAPPRPVFEY